MKPLTPTGPHSESGKTHELYQQMDVIRQRMIKSSETQRFLSTSRYFFTQSKNTTLDFSSSNWDLSLDNIGLHSEPLEYIHCFRYHCYKKKKKKRKETTAADPQGFLKSTHTVSQKSHQTFVFSLLLNQLLVEIPCFLQISCFNYQLLLQFLIKGNHTKSKGP